MRYWPNIRPLVEHAAFWPVLVGTVVPAAMVMAASLESGPPARPKTKTATCAEGDCHQALVNRAVAHADGAVKCQDCHQLQSAGLHTFTLKKQGGEMCRSCHIMAMRQVVHAPVQDGNCVGCHDPHGSEHPSMLVAEPGAALCATCHEEDYMEKQFVHGPVAIGACGICHDSHSSDYENLLTRRPDRLCVDCHMEMEPTGVAARHVHAPLREGCDSCHDPHASDVRYQLHKPGGALCMTCHDDMATMIADSHVVHQPLLSERACATCHEPHFSQLPQLQRSTQPQLCLSCHDKEIMTAKGETLPNMAALLRDNPNHHGPIRDGSCTSCHQPHAGPFFRLLHQAYPPEFYAPFEPKRYVLCFSCHLSDLVKDESGTGLTGFRDGDLNLHWLHVNQEKGRTCRACHEVHASKRPFHIRESVPFGSKGWMLELNFEQVDDGGACTPACHKPRTYLRSRTPAVPATPAEDAQPASPNDGEAS